MNILFLSSVFPDASQPSMGTYNLSTCRALANEHTVRVIAPRPWPEVLHSRLRGRPIVPSDAALSAGIEVEHPTYWYSPKVMRERYGDFLWWSVRGSVERMADEFRPDAVLSYWAHPDGEAAIHAGRRLGVPVAVITGGSDVLLLPQSPSRGRRVRWVLNHADAVLTVSEGVGQCVIDSGVDGRHVHTVYQGVDETIFHPGNRSAFRKKLSCKHPVLSSDRPLMVWVGRMVDVKRLDVLIDGCALLKKQGRDFLVCLIGDGSQRPAVEQQIAGLGLSENVCLVGSLPPEALGDWYRAADHTLLTSDSEGLPNVLRESLACGTPFVSTDVGSIRELADERCCRLVPTGDPWGLAEAITTALDQPAASFVPSTSRRTWSDRASEIVAILQACGAGDKPMTTAASEKVAVPL